MNTKYCLDTPESFIDNSKLVSNSWLTGFNESDGHFGIKYTEQKKINQILVKDLLVKVLLLNLY